jgi:cell shape-determining protein MreC
MSPDQQQYNSLSDVVATLKAVERENEELRAMNTMLAKKVIELEDLVRESQNIRGTDLKHSHVSPSISAATDTNRNYRT